jgi:tRNA (Thr-GGU) A37 N-methylase
MQTGFTYSPIGVVRSPHTRSQTTPIQPSFAGGVTGTVELDPRLAPGLDGIEGFSHIHLIVALHAAEAMAPDDAAASRSCRSSPTRRVACSPRGHLVAPIRSA